MHAIRGRAAVGRIGGVGRPAPSVVVAIAVLVPASSTGWLRAQDDTGGPLPQRALVRIGTDDLRISYYVSAIALSPDGRLAAVADPGATDVRIAIFNTRTGRPIRRLTRSAAKLGTAECLAFSPDGSKLLWGEYSGEVALWDLKGERLVFREKAHRGQVSEVAFSPDGSLVASADEKAIHLRRIARPGEVVRTLSTRPRPAPPQPGPPRGVPAMVAGTDAVRLAFTPDGTRLLSGTWSTAMISVWRLSDGELLRQIGPVTASGLNAVSVSRDGRCVLSGGSRDVLSAETTIRTQAESVALTEIRLWDVETGERIRDFKEAEGPGFGDARLSPDGRTIAVAGFNELRLLDAATGRLERTIELPGSWGDPPAFSGNGALLAMPDENAVALFEVPTGRRLHHDPGRPVGRTTAAAWSPSGDRIVTGHADGVVRVRDAATGRLIWHKLMGHVVSPGGPRPQPSFVRFSRDGRSVVVGGRREDPAGRDAGVLMVCDAGSGRALRDLPMEGGVYDGVLLDGRLAVFALSGRGLRGTRVLGMELATGRRRWSESIVQGGGLDEIVSLQAEVKGPWFQAALLDGDVVRFNSLTGHEQRRFAADWRTAEQRKAGRPEEPSLGAGVFSADGRTLVTSPGEWIYVWEVTSGSMRRKFRRPHRHGCDLALAPDGRTLATADGYSSDDPGEDTIRLFDIETGEQVLALEPNDGRAGVLAFSSDGTRLFTGFERDTAMVWDVRSRERGTGPK
jgi:WD40 repeat protein